MPFPDRSERLLKIVKGLKLSRDLPLLKATRIPELHFHKLKTAVNHYLYGTLTGFYPDERFEFSEEMLTRYASAIEKLPNITPNGLLLPKKETFLFYNQLHRAVADAFEALGFEKKAEMIHAPVNVRIVNGKKAEGVDSRPRASTKIHSDIWAGEPTSAIMVFFPVCGDTENICVRFLEPREFSGEWIRPLKDFLEGEALAKGAIEYEDCPFRPGEVLLTDPFLLHQTVKKREGLRLSIDFRFLAKEKVDSDVVVFGERMKNYVSFQEWRCYGRTKLLTTEDPLRDFHGEDVVRDGYATNFSSIDIL